MHSADSSGMNDVWDEDLFGGDRSARDWFVERAIDRDFGDRDEISRS